MPPFTEKSHIQSLPINSILHDTDILLPSANSESDVQMQDFNLVSNSDNVNGNAVSQRESSRKTPSLNGPACLPACLPVLPQERKVSFQTIEFAPFRALGPFPPPFGPLSLTKLA